MSSRTNYESLTDFIAHLEVAGELVRITQKVSADLEITEITDRVSKMPGGGKALLFENVAGSNMPVLINAFGSTRRMAMALGVDSVEQIADDITRLINMKTPENFADKLASLPLLLQMAKCPPKILSTRTAPCQDIVLQGTDIDLTKLPILKCWPGDAGRFITFGATFTKSLAGKRNVGVYRLQVFNRNSTGMHWHIHKDGASAYDEYSREGRRMEVAVAIGCDPAVLFSATAPLPPGVDELLLAGMIRQKSVELVKCRTVSLEVPKEAEIVLEGYVDPDERRIEGPFGDHTGYYSLAGDYPVFHVTAITMKKNPTYLTTIVGKPPMEDCYMGKATERIFLPLLKSVTPEIVDYDLPWEGVFHNCVIASVHKRYPAVAEKLMHSLWGAGQMAFAKMILAVDEGEDVHNHKQIIRLVLDRIDINKSLVRANGVLDVLDHSAPKPLHGAKLGIDITSPVDGEEKAEPSILSEDSSRFEAACDKHDKVVACTIPFHDVSSRLAVVAINKNEPWQAHEIARELKAKDDPQSIRILLMVDSHINPADYSSVLWKFFNNVDPARDIFVEDERLIIDATKKLEGENHDRQWPDELEMDDDVKKKIDGLMPKLGFKK